MIKLTIDKIVILETLIRHGNDIDADAMYETFPASELNRCIMDKLIQRRGNALHCSHIGTQALDLARKSAFDMGHA